MVRNYASTAFAALGEGNRTEAALRAWLCSTLGLTPLVPSARCRQPGTSRADRCPSEPWLLRRFAGPGSSLERNAIRRLALTQSRTVPSGHAKMSNVGNVAVCQEQPRTDRREPPSHGLRRATAVALIAGAACIGVAAPALAQTSTTPSSSTTTSAPPTTTTSAPATTTTRPTTTTKLPAPTTTGATSTTTTRAPGHASSTPVPAWLWLVIALAVLLAIGVTVAVLASRRRRTAEIAWLRRSAGAVDQIDSLALHLGSADPAALPRLAAEDAPRLAALIAQLREFELHVAGGPQRDELVRVIGAAEGLQRSLMAAQFPRGEPSNIDVQRWAAHVNGAAATAREGLRRAPG